MSALELKNVHLVGVSMGSLVCAIYTALYPDEVESLTIMCVPGRCLFIVVWMSRGSCYPACTCTSRVMLSMLASIYVCEPPKNLNGTLAVDPSFQTLAVDISSNLQTSSTTARSRNAFLVE